MDTSEDIDINSYNLTTYNANEYYYKLLYNYIISPLLLLSIAFEDRGVLPLPHVVVRILVAWSYPYSEWNSKPISDTITKLRWTIRNLVIGKDYMVDITQDLATLTQNMLNFFRQYYEAVECMRKLNSTSFCTPSANWRIRLDYTRFFIHALRLRQFYNTFISNSNQSSSSNPILNEDFMNQEWI